MNVPIVGTREHAGYGVSLSPREVGLLAQWERERRRTVTIADLEGAVGEAARKVAHTLSKKGLLKRVGRGIYVIQPMRSLARSSVPSAVVLAAAFLQEHPYYLGGRWAATHHRLTEQQYVSVLDAFASGGLRSRSMGSARLVMHRVKPTLLAYGITELVIEGLSIKVSDVERTLLDLLDHAKTTIGLPAATRVLLQGVRRADPERLVRYAVRGSRVSTCQRLGVLLERIGGRRAILAPLRAKVGRPSSLLSLCADRHRRGSLNQRWNVIENDGAGA